MPPNMQHPPRSSWLRPTVANLPTPRSPGVATDLPATGQGRMRLMHLNESACAASPKAIAAAKDAASALHRYPDPMATRLTAEIAWRIGVPASRIVVGAGSEELIKLLVDISCDPGDDILVPAPSFPLFAMGARLRDAVPVRIPLTASGANDVDRMLALAGDRTRLVFCCTPNPPNGACTAIGDVARLAARLPERSLLVMDEAYREFAMHAGEPDLFPVVQQRPGPWVSLRTFSKAYALAGMRVGYAICSCDQIANALRTARLSYMPSTVAQEAALAALQDEEHMASCLDTIALERKRLSDGLRDLGLSPYSSVTNFVSVTMPFPAAECVAALRAKQILVRDWRDPDYLNEIRISVGLQDDTDALLVALRAILRDRNAP